jgi:transcriptional regulator GlxA family with amidase domain
MHLLRTSTDDVERIAAAVGYADGVTLRNLLRRKLGRGVREIRLERAARPESGSEDRVSRRR